MKLEQLEHLHSEIPPTTPWLPILVIHITSQVKTKKVKVTNLKKNAKISNFEILQKTFHVTYLLKLVDEMYKYEMDPTRTVGATERTQDAGRKERQMYRRTEWNQYTSQQLRCAEGIITYLFQI